MRAVASTYQNQVAQRIVAGAAEAQLSMRELSRRAKLNPTTASKVCGQLETGDSDVGLGTLTALAQAMGKTLAWLLYGDNSPAGIPLRELPGWENAAREAIDRLGADPETVAALGGWFVHDQPRRLDAFFIAGIARSFRGG